jgi:hypothetical protein
MRCGLYLKTYFRNTAQEGRFLVRPSFTIERRIVSSIPTGKFT